jgi:hypothetical protein
MPGPVAFTNSENVNIVRIKITKQVRIIKRIATPDSRCDFSFLAWSPLAEDVAFIEVI